MSSLRILTWNLYLGADISRIFGAGLAELPDRVAGLWAMVGETDFAARAQALADCRAGADVLALQEVFRWAPGPPGRMPPASLDFLALVTAALAERGLNYDLAARSAAPPLWLPLAPGQGGWHGIWLQDAVVILVRRGGCTADNPLDGRFGTRHQVTLAGSVFPIDRGWVAADLWHQGRRTRLVCTHLEYFKPEVQLPQLAEILAGPADVEGPVVIAGDFNSGPQSPVWRRLAEAGFVDGWDGQGAGATSGQHEALRNEPGMLADRIDAVFARGMKAAAAQVLGDLPTDRTPGGLWPSDHAGVVVTLG